MAHHNSVLDKSLKQTEKKCKLKTEILIRRIVDFCMDTYQGRKQYNNIFKVLKENKREPKILCPENFILKNKREMKML